MRATLIFMACVFMIGCATAPVIEQQPITEKPIAEEPIRKPPPEITTVPATQEGKVTKLSGAAYMRGIETEEYFVLWQGGRIPIGRIFYLAPKTTMRIAQQSGEDIFLYSKDHEVYFILKLNTP